MNNYLHEEFGEVQIPVEEIPMAPKAPVFPLPFPPPIQDDVEDEDEGDGEGDCGGAACGQSLQ